MSDRSGRVDCFFYGLYMSPSVLSEAGAHPEDVRVACLADYCLDLRGSAKVIMAKGEEVWGTVISLDAGELSALYSHSNTKHYQLGTVVVLERGEGGQRRVDCYNAELDAGADLNVAYLQSLLEVAVEVGLPEGYVAVLNRMSE